MPCTGSNITPNSADEPPGWRSRRDGHGALAPQCELGFLDNGFRCALPAVAYVEFHMVGHCQRFDCDAHGNACGYVCADHLDALEYTARMHGGRDAAHGPVAAAVQSCRSMPDVWQNTSERIRHPASRGGTVMPNTWATGIHSWPRRCGLRCETIWPAVSLNIRQPHSAA